MRIFGAAAIFSLGLTSATLAQHTNLLGQPAATPMFYVQLLGGANLGLDATLYLGSTFDTLDKTWYGYAQGGTVGVNVWEGFSVEADLFHTSRKEGNGPVVGLNTYQTTSVMGNLKYTLMFDKNFGVYAAAGLGYIYADHFRGPAYNQRFTPGGAGYQLIGGVIVQLTENFAAIGEARYQNTFENYELGGSGSPNVDIPTATAVAGFKVSF